MASTACCRCAGLAVREIMVLRACGRYLLQTGLPFSQAYMERVLQANPGIALKLFQLFDRRLNPTRSAAARSRTQPLEAAIAHDLEAVTSLDADRILRAFLHVIRATVRTNFWQTIAGANRPCLSLKLDSQAIPELPLPRPLFEVFVYSPEVEGVHLRMAQVARGGIRWSDRREDFRTEVLGLMKAQNVKNTVIVPMGAKGGFVVKRSRATTPEERQREGIRCYQTFMRGLLDITDNIVKDRIVPPPLVARRDADDPYLVVAADKGTASFSDIANAVSAEYSFWLGDAFASGGSAGYDHKKMGITARGRLGIGETPFPRTRSRHPGRGLFGVRHRRHVGRCLRQWNVAVTTYPPGRGVRSPAYIPGPRAGYRGQLRRTRAAVCPAPLLLG